MTTAIKYHRPPQLNGVELLHLSDPDFNFAPHVHDAYVFWFNGQGGERVQLGGSADILQPDSFGVVAPGEVHANHAVTDHRTLQSLYVDETTVKNIARQLNVPTTQFRSRLQCDPHARTALARLHAELMAEEDPFRVHETFLRIFGFIIERHGENVRTAQTGTDPAKVRQAKTIMRERSTTPLELDELASLCQCTPCHLIRLFRRETGMTPHAYLMELRLADAKARLVRNEPISDIAFASGFTDQSHLTRRFRNRYGVTPGQYRQQIAA